MSWAGGDDNQYPLRDIAQIGLPGPESLLGGTVAAHVAGLPVSTTESRIPLSYSYWCYVMSHIRFRCTHCGERRRPDISSLACRGCDAPLEVEYLDMKEAGLQPANWSGPDIPMPQHLPEHRISLGEGDTPCVVLPAVREHLGLRAVHAKLEFMNPTGSFKDRGTTVMVSVAREHGVTEVVEDSSGNAGASVAAYAVRAGIKAHIFAPSSAPAPKLRQIEVYGAEVHAIEGPREDTEAAAVAYHKERGLVYASHNLSPYFLEGTKTLAYEIVEQFEDSLPSHLVFPVGNGSLFIGAWKGFRELRDAGHIAQVPRLHCIQARAVMPIVAAYRGEDWNADPTASTVAGGIAAAAPARQEQILGVLRDTNGTAEAVDEPDIMRWQGLLAAEEGIYAEPTSAAAFAGLEALVSGGVIGAGETVLVPITGSGLKDAPPA